MSETVRPEQEQHYISRAGIFAIYLDLNNLAMKESWLAAYVYGGSPEMHRQDSDTTRNAVRLLFSKMNIVAKEAAGERFADMAYKLGQGEAWERIAALEEDPLQLQAENPELYQEVHEALQKRDAA